MSLSKLEIKDESPFAKVTMITSVIEEGNASADLRVTGQGNGIIYRHIFHIYASDSSVVEIQTFLTAEEYPVLARVWNNDADEVFDVEVQSGMDCEQGIERRTR